MSAVAAPERDEILRDGRLGGCDTAGLAARFGTPLFLYDFDAIGRQVMALHDVLPSRIDLAYAVKANPSLGIVAWLGSMGLGADVASRGELATVLRAGIPPERVVMTGPGKRDDELEAAVASRVGTVTVESLGELGRLERFARESGRSVRILLRSAVAPDPGRERIRLIGDDGAGKFGMGSDDLVEAARRAVRSPHLDLLGVHAFGASNVLDASVLADHAEATVALGRRLAAEAGFELRLVDVGGGLGIPYREDESPLDLAALGRRLAALDEAMAADAITRDTRLLLEPGRFLVGAAGVYLARVVDRKAARGREVVVLDGGIHHLVRPALTRQSHRVRRVGPNGGGRRVSSVTVAGPLCSGLDVFATDAVVETPEVGDHMAVLDVGAYGFTESMPYFLSHPIPAEVAVRDGRAQLLRPRLEPDALLAAQRLPSW